jgi:transcriptional regulator with XRE-family HTH domain
LIAFGRRPNPVFSDEYRELVSVLARARQDAGMTQRALAMRLGKAASHVQRIESGQRRIDALEFYRIAKLLGRDPGALFAQVASRLDALSASDNAERPAPLKHAAE